MWNMYIYRYEVWIEIYIETLQKNHKHRKRKDMRSTFTLILGVHLLFAANAHALEVTETETTVIGPWIEYTTTEQEMFHLIGYDGVLLFMGATINDARVDIIRGSNKTLIGQLEPPSRGWVKPFEIKITNVQVQGSSVSGHLYVMDSSTPLTIGVFPVLNVEYDYSYSPEAGLSVTKIAEHVIPADNPLTPIVDETGLHLENLEGLVYPTVLARLSDGSPVVADTVAGTMWVADPDWTNWRLAFINLMDETFNFVPWPADVTVEYNGVITTGCTIPTIDYTDPERPVYGQPWKLPAPMGVELMPGLHGVDYIAPLDKVVFVGLGMDDPIGAMDASLLADQATPPFMKPWEELVPAERGITGMVGLVSWNEYKPDSQYVYWQSLMGDTSIPNRHPLSTGGSPMFRANIYTGDVEKLASDHYAYDFPSHSYPFPCPRVKGQDFTCIFSVNTMQERLADANAFFMPPWSPEPTYLWPPEFLVPVTAIKE